MPTEKDLEQAGFFENRIAKRDKHLRKWARKSDTGCYRVYDRDIPEIPLSLDRYGDAAVLYLYERPYEKPEAEESAWLELMAGAAAASRISTSEPIREAPAMRANASFVRTACRS